VKVLLVHNLYQQAGGEDTVVSGEKGLLEANGDEVRLFTVANTDVKGVLARVRTALSVAYSSSAHRMVAVEIASFQPDIVHVHNFFPLLTPSVYDACSNAEIPVVQTLHNFRTICPGAFLSRNGEVCEVCLTGSPYRAVLHRCYRNSRSGSLAVARMVAYHCKRGTWQHKVDRFIALTEFAKTRFVAAGFPPGKIAVKPNYTQNPSPAFISGLRQGALFVGRLSPEKGIATLLTAWRHLNVSIRFAGDGPLADNVRLSSMSNVVCLGKLSKDELAAEMHRAAFLVMPSEWYEGFPMVLVEAFAYGLPVIASRMGSMAEIVADGVTGLHFEAGNANDLAVKVRWAAEHPEEMRAMGENARREYERKYTPEVNHRQLKAIYDEAINNKEKGVSHH
jgi:glycosyltransferase involved in cell wall biosynthesis